MGRSAAGSSVGQVSGSTVLARDWHAQVRAAHASTRSLGASVVAMGIASFRKELQSQALSSFWDLDLGGPAEDKGRRSCHAESHAASDPQ